MPFDVASPSGPAPGGPEPIVIVATTVFVFGSIRTTFHSWCSTTQTAPGVVTIVAGAGHVVVGSPRQPVLVGQTGMVATTLFVDGSIRETVPATMFDVHTAPSPVATDSPKLLGEDGRSSILAATVPAVESIRKSSVPVRTHAEPKPTAPPTGVPT